MLPPGQMGCQEIRWDARRHLTLKNKELCASKERFGIAWDGDETGWWPGTGLNRRRRPFQCQPIRFFNDLQDRGDCLNTRETGKNEEFADRVVG